MKKTQEYFRGCLLGGAIGDALGWPAEFISLTEIKEQFGDSGITELVINENGVAEITDDTQMTLFTAEGILRTYSSYMIGCENCDPPSIVYNAYLRWFDTQYGPEAIDNTLLNGWLYQVPELHVMRGPGHTCLSALRSGVKGTIDQPITNSKGCGGVMRVAPIGLSEYMQKFELACDCAAITHGHPSGYIPAGMLAHIIHHIIMGGSIVEAVQDALKIAKKYDGCQESVDIVNKALELAQSNINPLVAIKQLGEGWVGEEALAIALYCSLKFQDDFKQAIITAVNHDGDSDSTGAITGNILGAYLGVSAIPKEWLAVLEIRNIIVQLADDLLQTYESSDKWHEKYPSN